MSYSGFSDSNHEGDVIMKKIIKIELHDNGKYCINASGFPLSEEGMMEAVWILKDSQNTIKEAFEKELHNHLEEFKKLNKNKNKKIETEMEAKLFKDLSQEDVLWLKNKFGKNDHA